MSAYLDITSIPTGAKIFLDGVDTLLTTPTTTPFILPSGTHNYILSLNNYESVVGTIDLIDNEHYTVGITLTESIIGLYEKALYIGAAALIVSIISMFSKKNC